jgi:hypothetical protein
MVDTMGLEGYAFGQEQPNTAVPIAHHFRSNPFQEQSMHERASNKQSMNGQFWSERSMKKIISRVLLVFATVTAQFSLVAFTYSAQAQVPANLGAVLGSAEDYNASANKGYQFQDMMMDAYASGSTVRLTQSYSDQALGATAFTYDNAVAIDAYLIRGTHDDVARAEVLGNGLVYAQATNFPFNDGRFAQAYFVNTPATDGSGAYITPAAFPFYFYGSAVGDQAWAGMALAQLYRRTGKAQYLMAALKVGNWIVTNTYNTLGAGGYSFGTNINQYNQSVPSPNGKSTEHNIDTYAFFSMLARITHNGSAANGSSWKSLAQHALDFVLAMYNPAGGYFYTGTLGDQITINLSPIPEDCQDWSYLALLNNRYANTIDWALANLQTTDTAASPHSSLTGTEKITGIVFDTASLTTPFYDPNAVWLEGTAHTVSALIARIIAGRGSLSSRFSDLKTVELFVKNSREAQAELGAGQTVNGTAIPIGEGLVASTSVMDTGFGYTYGPSLHIGATGWYLIAIQGANPFQLGYLSLGR